MEIEIPDFLLEMSKQMAEQPSRCTSHPFWQVRCKRFVVTEKGYNEHHFVLCDDEGEFFRSDTDHCPNEALFERHEAFCRAWAETNEVDFLENYSFSEWDEELPDGVKMLYVQEVEEVVSTHLTQHDAEGFIKRKQHDYPPLYTWVESAYWSPQFKQLQDWIISLTKNVELSV